MKRGRNRQASAIDALIPLVVPEEGITRSQLAKVLRISYSQATRSLELMRRHRILSRRIRKSQYVYRLTAGRDHMANGITSTIHIN